MNPQSQKRVELLQFLGGKAREKRKIYEVVYENQSKSASYYLVFPIILQAFLKKLRNCILQYAE